MHRKNESLKQSQVKYRTSWRQAKDKLHHNTVEIEIIIEQYPASYILSQLN